MRTVLNLGLSGGLLWGMWSVVGLWSPFFGQTGLFLAIAVLLVIGYATARKSGRRSHALQAGALAGACSGLIYGLARYFIVTASPAYGQQLLHHNHLTLAQVQAVQGFLGLAFGGLGAIGLGVLLGLVGGFLGSLLAGSPGQRA